MIKDIISFTLGSEKFAVDILKTPLILSASKYLPKKFTHDNNGFFFQFEGKSVKIINLHSIFSIDFIHKTEKSKLLVGYFNEDVLGLFVDSVDEIINLYENVEVQNQDDLTVQNKFIKKTINVSNENVKIIDIDSLIKQSQILESDNK